MPGLIAVAQSSDGSVANVRAIDGGAAESGLVQSDVAHWAYTGTGIFEGEEPMRRLNAIANLYPEHVHVVLPWRTDVETIDDLKGKRISLGPPASGARVGAALILEAAGLVEGVDYVDEPFNIGKSAQLIQDGGLDAFLTVAGVPAVGVAQLAATAGMRLLSIPESVRKRVVEKAPFYFPSPIPAGTYERADEDVQTLAVGAQWLISADQPDDLVYAITEALWNQTTRRLLDQGHPLGGYVQRFSALDAVTVPLHPGAERFYREQGMLR